MATLADELLNDFEASGSEAEEDRGDELLDRDGAASPSPANGAEDGNAMEIEGDLQGVQREAQTRDANGLEVEDEDEAKARVEKMQLGGVNDVRSVAGLMKTLAPVMEVSLPLLRSAF